MKSRTGYVAKAGKSWMARLTYTDPETGRRKDIRRFAQTKTEAQEILQGLRQVCKDYGTRPIDGERMTITKLIEHYTKAKIKPAEYHGDRKIAGLRSYLSAQQHVESLKNFFGSKRLKSITPSDLETYKQLRLKQQTFRGTERTITAVNRELETFRAMLNFAKQQGWLIITPFERAKGIISKADEKRRERVISAEEERQLLAACVGPREHLRPILICALDTAMRRGEILKLCWRDVDFLARTITVTAMNSKTARPRTIGITNRLIAELQRLWDVSPKDADESVFGISDNFNRSWRGIVEEVGLLNLRFHDCRHTCITRWVSRMPVAEIMRLSGHSTLAAFSIYVNATEQSIRRGAEALESWQEEFSIQPSSTLVN